MWTPPPHAWRLADHGGDELSVQEYPEDQVLKIRVVELYNSKLDERERRKTFLVDHGLLGYRKKQVTSLTEAERFDLDSCRREVYRFAC